MSGGNPDRHIDRFTALTNKRQRRRAQKKNWCLHRRDHERNKKRTHAMESRTDPQFQNNDPYPHVLTLTCEEESCSLRLFPPIPLQSDEEAMSMARRRQRLLSLSTQRGLQPMRQCSTTRRESPQKGSRHFHMSQNDEEGAKPNTRPTSNGTNECHSEGEDSSLEHGYDESGYSLPNRQQPGQIHHRPRRTGAAQRRMSIQTPFLTGSLVSDDDEDWNSRFQRVIEDLLGIGINTHTCEFFHSHSHDQPRWCSQLFPHSCQTESIRKTERLDIRLQRLGKEVRKDNHLRSPSP